jgi:hypothetical protein
LTATAAGVADMSAAPHACPGLIGSPQAFVF